MPDFVRTQIGKPGAYTFEPVDEETRASTREEIERSVARGLRGLRSGSSSEASPRKSARLVLPLSTYTKYYWSCNPRSLMHFCSLRNHADAQFEIREYASAAESFLEKLMPVTHASYVANDRTAP